MPRVTKRSLDLQAQVASALAAGPAIATPFPAGNTLGDQLRIVARLISVSQELGAKRQVFFVSLGGFDNHDSILTTHPTLMTRLGAAMKRLLRRDRRARRRRQGHRLHRVGFRPHAHLERQRLGPWLGLDPFRHGRRRPRPRFLRDRRRRSRTTAPTMSARAGCCRRSRSINMRATLASWFGVSAGNLPTVLPNINNYNPSTWNLGFV